MSTAASAAAGFAVALIVVAGFGRQWLRVAARLQKRKSHHHMLALRDTFKLRQALRHKLGVDIGGTLAKIVVASESTQNPMENVKLIHSTHKHELCFTARSGHLTFAFLSTPTETLEAT